MKVKAQTSNGTWWTLNTPSNISTKEFGDNWSRLPYDALIQTKNKNVYLNKINIVAIGFEKEESDEWI